MVSAMRCLIVYMHAGSRVILSAMRLHGSFYVHDALRLCFLRLCTNMKLMTDISLAWCFKKNLLNVNGTARHKSRTMHKNNKTIKKEETKTKRFVPALTEADGRAPRRRPSCRPPCDNLASSPCSCPPFRPSAFSEGGRPPTTTMQARTGSPATAAATVAGAIAVAVAVAAAAAKAAVVAAVVAAAKAADAAVVVDCIAATAADVVQPTAPPAVAASPPVACAGRPAVVPRSPAARTG